MIALWRNVVQFPNKAESGMRSIRVTVCQYLRGGEAKGRQGLGWDKGWIWVKERQEVWERFTHEH
jgi:hypothetical protein